MNKTIVAALFVILLPICARADEPTFEDLKAQFQAEVIAMASDGDVNLVNIETRLMELARRVYGPHPDVLKQEALRLYDALPQFDAESLDGYLVVERADDIVFPVEGGMDNIASYMLVIGWDPNRNGSYMKTLFLSRRMSTQDFGKRSMLTGLCPDRIYKFPDGEKKRIVVESLGEYFIIDASLSDAGVFMPQALTWMKRKPAE